MPIPWILTFCAGCGALLSAGLGLEEAPTCDNCGADVKEREARIEGEFTEGEAARLVELAG